MKTPTLEEVKEYFKNAKEVKCLSENKSIELKKDYIIALGSFKTNFFAYDNKERAVIDLWEVKKGYAEIISYIEPTTEVRNSVLLQLAENNSFSEEILKKECPKLFESEINLNNWYWNNEFQIPIFIESFNYDDNYNGYGFNKDKEFFSLTNNVYKQHLNRLATPQEVETALIQEAKKRGFVDTLKNRETKPIKGIYNIETNNEFTFINNGILYFKGVPIFKDGIWATIIETPTDIIEIVEKYGKDKVISLIEKM